MTLRSEKILILVLTAVLMSGCGAFSNLKKSTGNLVRDFRAPDDDLKKTVFRVTLDNQVAAANQDMGAVIDSGYLETLSQSCPALDLIGQEASEEMNRLFQKSIGPSDNLALIRIGKQLGLSAVVRSRFYAVAVRQQDKGFLWLRKKLPFAWVGATTEVYDTETGAKYLDQTITRELKLTEEDAENVRKGSISSVTAVEKAVAEIIQEMADTVCDAVMRKPWKGYISGIAGETLTLSSGSRTGLSTGRVLKVYDTGQRIQGAEGQTFLLPGKKIGEVRITSISSDSAEAVITSGSGFRVDDVVKTK